MRRPYAPKEGHTLRTHANDTCYGQVPHHGADTRNLSKPHGAIGFYYTAAAAPVVRTTAPCACQEFPRGRGHRWGVLTGDRRHVAAAGTELVLPEAPGFEAEAAR